MNLLNTKAGPLDLRWRLFGTQFHVKITFWLFMAFFGWMMGLLDKGVIFLAIWVFCGFISVLVHELGHHVMGRIFGYPGVVILHAFGGAAIGEYLRAKRWQRILIAAAGPIAGLSLYGIAYLLTPYVFSRLAFFGNYQTEVLYMLAFFVFMNLFWNLWNLPPIVPLDGGMIMKEVVTGAIPRGGYVVAMLVSLSCALGIVAYSLYKYFHPEAPFLEGVIRPLFPVSLRDTFGNISPDPVFNAIMYGFMAVQNFFMLMKKQPAETAS